MRQAIATLPAPIMAGFQRLLVFKLAHVALFLLVP